MKQNSSTESTEPCLTCLAPAQCGKVESEEGTRLPYEVGCYRVAAPRIYTSNKLKDGHG